VQLVLRDLGPFCDQEPAVAILVPIGLLLATPERGGAISLAGLERERRQAIERPCVAGLEGDELLQDGAFRIRVVGIRGEPRAERPSLRHREAIGRDHGQRAPRLAGLVGIEPPLQDRAPDDRIGRAGGQATVQPPARLGVVAVLRGQARARQPDPVVVRRGLRRPVEHRLDLLGGDDHEIEPPQLAERGRPIAEWPDASDLAEQPAHLVEPPFPEQQLDQGPAGLERRGSRAPRCGAIGGFGVGQPTQGADQCSTFGESRCGGRRRARRHPRPGRQGRVRPTQLRLTHPQEILDFPVAGPPRREPRQPIPRRRVLPHFNLSLRPAQAVADLPVPHHQPTHPGQDHPQQGDRDDNEQP
jgi:hypothetical protein